ncbi:MAG: hypothetical protein Q4F05_03385 [bacterium]|nr:hypothetical protein [bacterium]
MKMLDVKNELQKHKNIPIPMDESKMELCIKSLPDVKRGKRIVPLIKLQCSYISKWLYLVAVVLVLSYIPIAMQVGRKQQILAAQSIFLALLLAATYELFKINFYQMEELERSCTYGYAKIFLAKVLVILMIVGGMSAAVEVVLSVVWKKSFLYTLILLDLPFLISITVTLLVSMIARIKRNSILLMLFLVITLLVNDMFYAYKYFMEYSKWALAGSFLAVCVVFAVLMKKMISEVCEDEVIGYRFS